MANYNRALRRPQASIQIVALLLGLPCLCWSCQVGPVASRREATQQSVAPVESNIAPCCPPEQIHDLYAAPFRLSPRR